MSKLLIGWSEIDTTPGGTVDLSGQYYHRVSKGIHSRLSATVLALESGNDHAVMVSLDLAGFRADFQEELHAILRLELPELDVSKVFLNVIHTHNAPAVDSMEAISWLTEPAGVMPIFEYREFLLGKLKTAVISAWRSRRPGGISNTLGSARVGHCRRAVYTGGTAEMYGNTDREDFIGMEGGEDSGVDLLFTFDCKNKPTGVILNLACPSQVMEATYEISSDFIGETRQLLKKRFGNDFKTFGQISAAGCQSPRDLTRNYKGELDFWHGDGVEEIGRRLIVAVEGALSKAQKVINFSPAMKHGVKALSLPLRRASKKEFMLAEKTLKELEAAMPEGKAYKAFCKEVGRNEKIAGHPGPYDSKLHHFVLIQNAKAVIARYKEQDKSPMFDMELHVLRLEDAVFVTNPFELYLDFGHQIKARSRAGQTFVVQLCGDTGGYLPSARAEQLGGYGGLIINGKIGSEGGKILVDETLAEVEKLWK
ncbi:MAG: hypothetical protein WC637_00630 [Victivallales bacterium]